MKKNKYFQEMLIFIFCGLGFVLSLGLQKYLLIPSFAASAATGFMGSFVPQSKIYDAKKLTACIYTGSFSSMCSLSFFSSWLDVVILSLVTGFYFVVLNSYFKGFGGKLGSIGFVSSLSFIFLKVVL